MTVKAMKSGAVEFLTKPFLDQDLLDAIDQALDRDRAMRRQESNLAELRKRYESLSAREREVLQRASAMLSTEDIARDLYISVNTVKTHLRNTYRKLGAGGRGEAVRRARQLGLL